METKSFASLTAGLLARKGTARPAMRRPHTGSFPVPTLPLSVQDDLGWNDMGEDRGNPAPAAVSPLAMIAAASAKPPVVEARVAEHAPAPPPREQQARLEEALATPAPVGEVAAATETVRREIRPALTPAPGKTARKKPAAKAAGVKLEGIAMGMLQPRRTRAAFTLRLDPDRHLRLRLACALSGNSAQQIVTAALDALLAAEPQLEALAGQLASADATAEDGKAR